MTDSPKPSRAAWKQLTPAQQAHELRRHPALAREWTLLARDEQLPPPGDWSYWLILAGRGFGKTRTGAEWVRQQVKTSRYVNLIGATADDARDIMVEGESGLLAICPRAERPQYKSSQHKLVWPNGAQSLVFSADEPERLRGKQHAQLWCDELAAWRYPDAWAQAKLGLRLGTRPQACLTTTPRPCAILRELLADPATHLTRGSTWDNRANLAPRFFDTIIKTYEGTRLGRQELNAELLDDAPGALWQRAPFDALRVPAAPALRRIVVAVDPAVTSGEGSDETGIIVAGAGEDEHFYVLADASLTASPHAWAKQAVTAYHTHRACRLIAETNNGGDLVEAVIRQIDPLVAYKKVTASRGKRTRAEPIAALYEQGRVHHVGPFDRLEDQLCSYDPQTARDSPDRLDALVWALTELTDTRGMGLLAYYGRAASGT